MEQAFPARQLAPAYADQIFDDIGRDARAARDIAAGKSLWVFFEHRTLAEIVAAERRP
ncbi:MAG: hypothetical protein AB7H90_05280 [Alphaproteobacteria bacterium]